MHAFIDSADLPSSAVIEWISRIVAFDTTSRNSNLDLIEDIRGTLSRVGFRCVQTFDASGRKSNLLASLPDAAGGFNGGICLSGHVDTVPVDGQDWASDPFSASCRDGKLYGRGACDMKGFVGTALAVAVANANRPLSAPIHLALSYDEELGCLGAPSLVAQILESGIKPQGCIVGEPTMMQVVCAHKGANVGHCRFEGLACHSSLAPSGVNAIEYAARLIVYIRSMAARFAERGPFAEHFNVPWTTLQTGTISGGVAVNTVPSDCEFTFEFRNLPGTSANAIFDEIHDHITERLRPEMRARTGHGDVILTRLAAAPAFEADEASPFVQLFRTMTGDAELRKVAYGTEAGLFSEAGIPTVVCGPGDIAQAHKADEFVSLSQLARCEGVLNTLIDEMCAVSPPKAALPQKTRTTAKVRL